ncbi:SurA N-terminal domain-containing protein [Paenibacillus sp. NPDC057967]|uniref:SurA N-terminal domain-containing protein n=1 Tax=Paenibacillus sp. NPDC057967 TaxID=3346293 RepID=UPI0036DBDA7E
MKKRVVLAVLIVIAIGISVFAFVNPSLQSEPVLAKGAGVEVTVKRFKDAKQNLELAQRMLAVEPEARTDEELLDQILTDELLYSYAKKKGVSIPEEELRQFIDEQKAMLEDTDQVEMAALMQERIRLTGMDEESFWQDKATVDGYRYFITIGKLTELLVKEDIIQGGKFAEFQKKLLQDNKSSIKVNWDALEKS